MKTIGIIDAGHIGQMGIFSNLSTTHFYVCFDFKAFDFKIHDKYIEQKGIN